MAEPNYETVQWREGGDLVVFNGYIFQTSGGLKATVSICKFQTISSTSIHFLQGQYYRCKTSTCPVTGKINLNEEHIFRLGRKQVHNHQPDNAEITVKEATRKLKEKVKQPNSSRKKLYQETLAELPADLRKYIKPYTNVKSALRKTSLLGLPQCRTLADLSAILGPNTVELEARSTFGMIDDKPFFRYHFQIGPNEALLFLNQAAIDDGPKKALATDPICVDGTFRTRPRFHDKPLAQVLMIFRITNNAVS